MKRNRRKIFVLLMIFCLTFTVIPSMAFATAEADPDAAVVKAQEEKAEEPPDSEQAVNAENAEPASVDAETVPQQDKTAEPEKPADEAVPSEQESEKKDPKQEEAAGEDRSEGKDQKQEKPEEKAEKADSEEDFDWLTYEAVDPVPAPVKFRLMQVSTGDEKSYTASRNSADGMQFTVTLNGKEFHGLCCEPAVKAVSSGKAIITKLGKEALSRKIAWKYRSWLNDSDRNYNFGGLKKAVILEAMFQYANHKTDAVAQWKDNGWSASTRQAIIDAVNDLKNNETSETLDIPNNFTAYRLEVENKASGGSILGQDGVVWGYPVDGKVQVRKKATAEAQALYEQDPVRYSVKGAKFRLYTDSSCSTKATNVYGNDALLTISRDGIDVTTGTLTMEVGTYYMKEVAKPSSGAYDYERDDNGKVKIHKVTVKEDETVTVTFIDDAKETPSGYLVLKKSSADPSVTSGNSMYSLKGAKYQVYTKAACTESDKAKDANGDNALFEMEADGTTDAIEFELGADANSSLDVWVKEVAAPKGYVLDTRVYGPYKITKNNTAAAALEVSVSDTPAGAAKLTLVKKGKESTDPEKLKGAEFEIEYHDVASEDDITSRSRKKTWKFATTVKGSGAGAYAGIDLQTDNKLSGDDFYMNGTQRIFPIGTYKITETKAPGGYKLDPAPTYVTVTQSGAGGPAKFANERIERTNEEEPPLFIRKVNTATGAVLQGAKLQIVQGSVVVAEWTTDATEWHEVKNLEPGDYVLREISAPYGFEIANDIPFTFDGSSSKSITMSNTPVTVSTTAVSKATGKHIGPRKASEVITDTVHMTGLIKDREYRLTGQLMNKRTGAAVPDAVVSPKTFKATAATMDVPMDITFDSTKLADGDSVVVYETLHRMTKVHTETVPAELGKHQNINDAAQTVIYPGISTVAIDQSSQTHNLLAGPNATIIDTVTYKGLLPGVAYTLEGELFDKTTNRLTGIKGTAAIPANATANGTAKMTFSLDASGMENHTLVVYETLKVDSVTLAEHRNPNDADQTIYLPEVKTTLIDNKTRNHLSNAAKSVTVTDTVVCSNLIVGRTYTISGKLVFQDNGNDVIDNGHTVTATTQPFEATATTMTKTLTFMFDGSALEGKTVVAFEDLYTNNKKVGMHADIKDEGQSDHIPKVRTTALDSETKDHISLGDEKIMIHDTVSYENLIPGKTYTLTGKLMDKATGNEIPNVTTQPVEFKPDKANGTVVVDFVFNGKNWQNHKAVAFEKLYLGAKDQVKDNNLIGVHENLNDADQTVHIPEIRTTLKDTKSTDHIAFGEQTVTLKDTIEYMSLIKGKEYVATGRLMNKRTGEAVKVNGAEVFSEPVKFTAPDENGSVVVTFTFNGVSLPGETVVAFERLTYKGIPVAVHENINDAAQTVHLPKIRTVAAISDDNHVFTDTINYENLLPDRKYVFRGWLVDTATGTKIAGSDGKVELTATDANVNGSVKMEMNTAEYDNMYGHSMTAYEELYVIEKIGGKDTEIKVAEHKDRSGDASTNPQTIEIYHDLKVQKNVTGNLGDLTKNFEYTVAFTDLVPNVTYKVEGDDSKTFKAGADGKASVELILADDESVTIRQLPKSATYVMTEAASDHIAQYKMFSEDMEKKGAKIVTKEANNGTEAAKILATAKETVDLFDGTIVVIWENNRDIATLTGVNTYLGIWGAALTLVLAGIVTILARRRKNFSAE